MNRYLKPARLWYLARNEIYLNYKTILISFGAIFGLLLIINVSSVTSYAEWNFNHVFFPISLMVGGLITVSLAFSPLYDKRRGMSYLTLPASSLEKYLSRFLITSIGYLIAGTVIYILLSLLSAWITTSAFKMSHPIFNPFSRNSLFFMRLYIVCHSVMFFGAIYFRKNNLLKTLLSLFLLSLAISAVVAVYYRFVFHNHFVGFGLKMVNNLEEVEPTQDFIKFITGSSSVILYWIMAPFFWITGYLRFKETEV